MYLWFHIVYSVSHSITSLETRPLKQQWLMSSYLFYMFRDIDLTGFPGSASGKKLPANAGDGRHTGWIPGLGRSSGEGRDNSLPYSCLENSKDRGDWEATIHRVTKSWTWLKRLNYYHHHHHRPIWLKVPVLQRFQVSSLSLEFLAARPLGQLLSLEGFLMVIFL